MKIIAYLYSDPLLESSPDSSIWGLEVDKIYQDLGQRQQLQILLKECTESSPDYLLIRRLDELGDNFAEVVDCLTKLEALGIKIIATEQNYNSSHINSQKSLEMVKILVENFEEIKLNKYRHRLQKGHAKNRLKFLPPPGKAPYGYRRGKDRYIIDRSTAPVVKDFFEQFLLFGSLRRTVRYLEKKYGKKISVSTGHRWLNNPVYRGDLAYKNHEVIPDTHTPIISRQEAAQVDRLLRRNKKLPPRTASAPRSLAGLVVCESCQSSMIVSHVKTRNNKQEYLYLRPKNCPLQPRCKSKSYQEILERTIQKICQDLPDTVANLNLPNLEEVKINLQEKIAKNNQIIDQLTILKQEGILDEETAQLRNYKLQGEIAVIRTQLEQLPPGDLKVITKAVTIPQFWWDLSEAERRFYFREFISKILIVPLSPKTWELKLVFVF